MKDEVKWIQGNCLESLKKLEDKSINCCVTSPPYWGLRDYGTAKWEGGDENCDHKEAKLKSRYDYSLETSTIQDGSRTGTDAPKWKDECPTCGAVKEDEQLGLEESPDDFVENLVQVFREVRRVLRDDGTLWLNLGDTYSSHKDCSSTEQTITKGTNYSKAHVLERSVSRDTQKLKAAGLKNKDLVGIPWRVAFALRQDGWYLRQDIIWQKPNPMPESIKDRCTKSHEYIFLLSKNKRYFYDSDAVKEDTANIIDKRPGGFERDRMYDYDSKIKLMGRRPGGRFGGEKYGDNDDKQFGKYSGKEYAFTGKRNKRSVWSVPTKSFKGAHFATFPVDLITPCVLAGCPEKICVECDTPYTKEPIHGTITKSADDWEQNLYLLDEFSDEFAKIEKALSDAQDKSDAIEAQIITGYRTIKGCECKTDDFKKGTVLDTFGGAGTTGLVAKNNNRNAILLELNPEYIDIAKERIYPPDQLF